MDGYIGFVLALGSRVKAARKKAGMTQGVLAAHIGVTDRAIVNYEHGWRCMSVWTLLQICEALGTSADELLGMED